MEENYDIRYAGDFPQGQNTALGDGSWGGGRGGCLLEGGRLLEEGRRHEKNFEMFFFFLQVAPLLQQGAPARKLGRWREDEVGVC